MSEQIRCPMCGKPNPADAEICRYCHARLKPLRAGETPQPKSTAELESTLPPWMQNLREGTAPDALPGTNDLPLEPAAEAAPSKATPPEETPPPAEAAEPATDDLLWAPDEEEEDLPDWLKSLGGEEGEPAETAPAAAAAETSPQKPAAPVPSEKEAPAAETAPEEAAALPDWLSAEAETPAEGAPAEAEAALPDWLSGGEAPAPETEAPAAETAPAPEEAATLPDWLSAEAETPAEGAPAEAEAALPDWLSGGEAPTPETETPAEAAPAPEEAAALPDWLSGGEAPSSEAGPSEPPESEAGAAQPFVADVGLPEDLLQETPDWLALLSPEEEQPPETPDTAAETEATEEEAGPSAALSAGELPSWLEAMRPIGETPAESVAEDEAVETQGPLAGLRGVLAPPEPALVRPGRVATIGGKLFLTDHQEEQARTLQALLAEEFAPREPEKPPAIGRQRALRWLIGLVLLAAAFLPWALPRLQAPPPRRILPAALAAIQAVDAVPQGAPVLVGVDYSPAFAAEMETAAAPLLRDLLAKNARLTVVSTQPTGPALATHLFRRGVNSSLQEGQQYLNLGYLPGGTAGLFAFAQNPRLVFAHAAGHARLWETPFLQKIHHVGDFAMVVVITEDADTARAWIEQVRPALGAHTPLIAVISAQAEPMVEPYYETASHQVAGVVTGMAGSLAYNAARGRSPGASLSGQWSSYSDVVLLAALMVAAAGLYNLALGWKEARSRRAMAAEADLTDSEEDEA